MESRFQRKLMPDEIFTLSDKNESSDYVDDCSWFVGSSHFLILHSVQKKNIIVAVATYRGIIDEIHRDPKWQKNGRWKMFIGRMKKMTGET